MKKLLVSLALLIGAFSMFAQKPQGAAPGQGGPAMHIGRLYGKIIDPASKQPVAYASVAVFQRDSLIGGALTEDNGEFNITGLPMGMVKVKITFVGYQPFEKNVKIAPPDNVEQDLGDLSLKEDAKLLNAVDVSAEKTGTQISLEKRVFNVDKNITATGGTAEDVMKNVPSVSVDVDGGVKLRNSAATIYVDGKPSLMALTAIPANQIESVEVITNPSAKYEASATGGILNIVLKKNKKPGYNGMVDLGYGFNNRYNGMLNFNLREGRFNITTFYNINATQNPTTGYTYRTNRASDASVLNYFNQNTEVTFDNVFQNGRIGVEYSINNRNTLSLTGGLTAGKFNITSDQNYVFLDSNSDTLSYGKRLTQPRNHFNNYNVDLTWKKNFPTKDKSLIATATYSRGNGGNAAQWTTTSFDANGQAQPNTPELVNIEGVNTNQQAIFQVDYVTPINDSTKIETGIRSFWSWRDQQYLFNPYSYDQGKYILDPTFSQDALIKEDINAAYFTYTSKWKYNISYQLGLRFEQSYLNGDSRLDSVPSFGYQFPSTFSNLMNAFFPALYITKKIDASSELGINFSRKINRPGFMQLMPGIQNNDKQNVRVGNPSLQPEFINKGELNYNKMFGAHNWLSSVYVSIENNTIKPLIKPSEDDPSVLITTFVNGNNEVLYGFDNTLKLAVTRNFDITANANVFNFNVQVDTFSNTGWALNGKLNLTYRLPADFTLQINGNYEGNRPMPQGSRKGVAFADIAVKKSFFHNMASLTLSVNDVFNSRKDITIYDTPTYYQEGMRRRDVRFFKISLQAPFGKPDASLFRKKDAKKMNQQSQEMDY